MPQNLILGFIDRYANLKTRQHSGAELRELFTDTGRRHLAEPSRYSGRVVVT